MNLKFVTIYDVLHGNIQDDMLVGIYDAIGNISWVCSKFCLETKVHRNIRSAHMDFYEMELTNEV